MRKFAHYKVLADLFRYPDAKFPLVVNQCSQLMIESYPEAAKEMQIFVDYINSHNADTFRELYTKTFDVQAVCYLDLGYVIFGEDYKRGVFLVNMKQEQDKIGNDCGTDLPDNLSNMLTFFDKALESKIIDELAIKILIPGVRKMLEEFEPTRMDIKLKILKNRHYAIIQEELYAGNVYKHALSALLQILEKDFENISFAPALDPVIDEQHHKSFFNKSSVNMGVNQVFEINKINNHYKQD